MPEETQTWDSVTATPETPAAPVVDPPADPPVTPAAEAAPLETAPQLEAERTARESESPVIEPPTPEPEAKDEDIEDGDAPEILALPSGSSSRKWARRQFHDAQPTRTFLDFDKPIKEFGDDLFNRSQSRYTEHVKDIVVNHRDFVLKESVGMTYDEIQALKANSNGQPASTTTPARTSVTATTTATLPTEAELAELTNEQVIQRFNEYQSAQQDTLQKREEAVRSEKEILQKRLEAIEGKVTNHEREAFQTQVAQRQDELYNRVWSVVEDGIRNSGLEVQATDPPKIASLKKAAVRLLDKHNIESAFDAVDDNTKVVKYVFEATKRGEFSNAFREEDNLKVRARAAFESVKQSPEVKAILDEIESYANQSKGNSRAVNPVPPAPGSSIGVTIKPPSNWDEAIAQAKTA